MRAGRTGLQSRTVNVAAQLEPDCEDRKGVVKTYLEGDRFPGKVGRTIAESEAAFPMPPGGAGGCAERDVHRDR